uniref:Uncharacterized protein n=1 Tax=Anguilla anguilla TaxID=7936 RepID=A0A0E9XNW7_ANGAN
MLLIASVGIALMFCACSAMVKKLYKLPEYQVNTSKTGYGCTYHGTPV